MVIYMGEEAYPDPELSINRFLYKISINVFFTWLKHMVRSFFASADLFFRENIESLTKGILHDTTSKVIGVIVHRRQRIWFLFSNVK